MSCCHGPRDPDRDTILARLVELEVGLPVGAQVWGPHDGFGWRIVDRWGREPSPKIWGGYTIHATATAAGLAVRDTPLATMILIAPST